MEILGYIAFVVAGILIGLIGAGGSILTLPILVYLFAINPVVATAYSLFLVGSTSLAGVIPKYIQKNISIKTALIFGIPSMISVFLVRRFLVPSIPKTIFSIGGFEVSKGMFMMLLFGVIMIFASLSMMKKRPVSDNVNTNPNTKYIPLQGLAEGLITGLVGAGGGFIIIPILTLYAKLPIKKAIGTSMLIIAIKSLIGFVGDPLAKYIEIDWTFLFTVTLLSIFGMFIGNALSKRIDGSKLKKGFAWFIFTMGVYIIIKEVSRL